MIVNAKDTVSVGAGYGKLPNMSQTIICWFLPIDFGVVTRVKVGVDWKETIETRSTMGVVQALKMKDLMIYPEGERAWTWKEVHCLPDFQLDPNEYVLYDGVRYKVKSKKYYKEYGFVYYHLLQDYTGTIDETA